MNVPLLGWMFYLCINFYGLMFENEEIKTAINISIVLSFYSCNVKFNYIILVFFK